MVITGHLIIFLQQLTVRMCACIRTDRTCTHRTICTIMVTTQALLSCSSSNSSMNSTQSTSYFLYLTLWKAEPEQLYLQAAANLWLLAAPLPAARLRGLN